ncbi:MAG: epoxyqueuosine reductase QueH [Synergistaceae bacterium]|jgi:predicted adenine nucleotide alpha hydrolase (AANH) superfamily ATPase|nr:epoxyqueuosine reductase QueH [Synergistaceae bacterium]
MLHICCAPDATVPWPELMAEGYETDGFFYGSNIHPAPEWRLRRESVLALSGVIGSPVGIAEYEPGRWVDATYEMRDCPEGGLRCAECFALQLAAASRFASDAGGYDFLCTTLTISPHKDPALINRIGAEVSSLHGLGWIERVWRKEGGFALSVARSLELGLYRQKYCGCSYGLRDRRGDFS